MDASEKEANGRGEEKHMGRRTSLLKCCVRVGGQGHGAHNILLGCQKSQDAFLQRKT